MDITPGGARAARASAADMFLKMQGVTGEAGDTDHKGEIEVVSWSWGMKAGTVGTSANAQVSRAATIEELHVVKNVDKSSATLMLYLNQNRLVPKAQLTVRKAGKEALEYLKIDLEKVRVSAWQVASEGGTLVERVTLGFAKVEVTYTPQDATGAKGGGGVVFAADLERA